MNNSLCPADDVIAAKKLLAIDDECDPVANATKLPESDPFTLLV